MITYILNIDYLHCRGFISYQHAAAINCTNEIQFQNISDDVFADRMNTGLDWIESVSWWIGLDWIWKNGPMDISGSDVSRSHCSLYRAVILHIKVTIRTSIP